MVFVNYYDIPDLTNKKALTYFLCTICGLIISSIIYLPLFYLCFIHTKGALRSFLILIESAVIYPIILIYLLKLSIKIENKMCNKKKLIKK